MQTLKCHWGPLLQEAEHHWDSPSQRLGGIQGIQQLFSIFSDQVLGTKLFGETCCCTFFIDLCFVQSLG